MTGPARPPALDRSRTALSGLRRGGRRLGHGRAGVTRSDGGHGVSTISRHLCAATVKPVAAVYILSYEASADLEAADAATRRLD